MEKSDCNPLPPLDPKFKDVCFNYGEPGHYVGLCSRLRGASCVAKLATIWMLVPCGIAPCPQLNSGGVLTQDWASSMLK
jgi:hypothetical protein